MNTKVTLSMFALTASTVQGIDGDFSYVCASMAVYLCVYMLASVRV